MFLPVVNNHSHLELIEGEKRVNRLRVLCVLIALAALICIAQISIAAPSLLSLPEIEQCSMRLLVGCNLGYASYLIVGSLVAHTFFSQEARRWMISSVVLTVLLSTFIFANAYALIGGISISTLGLITFCSPLVFLNGGVFPLMGAFAIDKIDDEIDAQKKQNQRLRQELDPRT